MTYILRNGAELETELANLNMRLEKLEGVEPAPQPRTPRLVEAVETLMRFVEEHVDENYSHDALTECRRSLAAEKKRSELMEPFLDAALCIAKNGRIGSNPKDMREQVAYVDVLDLKVLQDRLDAYEKGEAQ